MEQVPRLEYTKNWEDPADFPTHESSEVQNRKDIQSLFTEIRAYLNYVLLPALERGIGTGGGGTGGGSGGNLDDYLPLNGGTMRGPLRLCRNPELTDEAATRAYVDTEAGRVRTDLNGSISAIEQSASEIEALVQDAQGNISSLSLRADGIESRVAAAEGGLSEIRQTADNITLEVSAPQTDGEQVYSRVSLRVGPNESYGYVQLSGNVDVSGQLSADALYAARGEVADLSVDRLTTSRRIAKYLRGDSSDDNFIRIQEQVLEFVTGTASGGTAQAVSPAGDPLYWPVDVSGLPVGDDGCPRSGAERIFTTTAPTAYPVQVYSYQEQVKRSIRFAQSASGVYEPVDIYGAGNQQGNNYARMVKSTEGFDLLYTTPAGKEIGIRMGAGGFVDITGTRRPDRLDFSSWAEGSFSETPEGSSTALSYQVAFDEANRPVRITDADGHATVIVW